MITEHVMGSLGARCEPDLSPYGTGDLGLGTSILVGVVFLLATAAILIWRWRHTRRGRALVTLSREERRDISDRLRQDPRFKMLKAKLDERWAVTFDRSDDLFTFRVGLICMCNRTGRILRPGHPEAVMLVVYLRRKVKPQRVRVELNVKTGEISEREVSQHHWESVVPD